MALLAPHQCIICYRDGEVLCQSCRAAECEPPISRCYMCNKLTVDFRLCKSHRAQSRLSRVWWTGQYDGWLKQLIWDMKLRRARDAGRSLGRLLSEQLPYLKEDTLVVPVPTASSRIRRRGFDQASIIARSFAGSRGLKYSPFLRRHGQQSQHGKRRLERLKNMHSTFSLTNSGARQLPGTTVLLIDDVLTTGATLESAARVLKEHGATRVYAAVIAHKTPD